MTSNFEELPECTAPGSCITCKGWTAKGRVIAEIHTDVGAGGVVVRCAGCVAELARRPSRQSLLARGRGRARG